MSWTIRNKLLVGFTVMILSFASLGGLTVYHIGQLNSVVDQLVRQKIRGVYLLGRVEVQSAQLRLNTYLHIRARSEADMAQRESDGRELRSLMKTELEEYEHLISTDEERRLFRELMTAQEARLAGVDRAQALSRAHDVEAAEQAFFALGQQAYQRVLDHLKTLVDYQQAESSRAATLAAETGEKARIQFITVALIALGVLLIAAMWLTASIATPVSRLSQVFVKMSTGDNEGAARDLHALQGGEDGRTTRDEVGMLLASARAMMDTRMKLALSLREGVARLSSNATQISATAKEYGATASEQASSVAEVSTTVEEIKQTSQAAAQVARQVAEGADEASHAGQVGRERIGEAVTTVQTIAERVTGIAGQILQLSEQTSQIGSIVDSVNDLAEQSNLLAVNASIEAAKAGEQGRGFAVVAAEVRSLAEQSKRATQQIRGILSDIQKATQSAVMATEEGTKRAEDGRRAIEGVRSVVENLAAALEDTSGKARQIAGASAQQASGIAQIAAAMENVSKAAQDNAKGVRQLEQAASELERFSVDLKDNSERL